MRMAKNLNCPKGHETELLWNDNDNEAPLVTGNILWNNDIIRVAIRGLQFEIHYFFQETL